MDYKGVDCNTVQYDDEEVWLTLKTSSSVRYRQMSLKGRAEIGRYPPPGGVAVRENHAAAQVLGWVANNPHSRGVLRTWVCATLTR